MSAFQEAVSLNRPTEDDRAPSEGIAGPSLEDEVTFLCGVDAAGRVAATAFQTWNWDTPGTYSATTSRGAKWGASAAGTGSGTLSVYFDPSAAYTVAEQAVVMEGFDIWTAFAGVNFTVTTDLHAAQITITRTPMAQGVMGTGGYSATGSEAIGSSTLAQATSGTLTLNSSLVLASAIGSSFTYPRCSIIHEIGHVLGLGHSGAYNGFAMPATDQFSAYDVQPYSMMSYLSLVSTLKYGAAGFDVSHYSPAGDDFWPNSPQTPMMLDILAMQRLYGAPVDGPLSGNNVFGFNCNITGTIGSFYNFALNSSPTVTIWDSGLNNTLDLSGFTRASTVNLNPGTFSSAGGTDNIAIALGTQINRLICGSGDTTVTCNDFGDSVTGGAGADTIISGAGNDTINGGAGADAVTYSGNRTSYTVSMDSAGNGTISGPQGTDSLTSVEQITFADRTIYFDEIVPLLSSSTPADDATYVSKSANIVLTFTERVRAGTGNIVIHRVSDGSAVATIAATSPQVTISGATVTIDPVSDLADATNYYVTIGAGAFTDIAGNPYAGISSTTALNFTTVDYSPPILSSSNPTNNATNVAVGADIVLTFDELVKAGSGNIVIHNASGNAFATIPVDDPQVVISGNAVTINPASNFVGRASYYITIDAGAITDLTDNPYWGFSSSTFLNFTAGWNTITGTDGNDVLTGTSGDDAIYGMDGNDRLDGKAGADTMRGGAGDDAYYTDNSGDVVTEAAGEGNDTIRTTLAGYTLAANVENLSFTGSGNFTGNGNALNNIINGGAGNDRLDGKGGADTMRGGAGDDVYYVDNAGDVVSENAGAGNDTVRTTSVSCTLAANVENLSFTGSGNFTGNGNALANIINGGAGNDRLDGKAGADTMRGGAGDDAYYADNAGDIVSENAGAGNDVVRTTLASYTLGANVESLSFTGSGNFMGNGNTLANIINGGSGNDRLDGKAGADTMRGGAGDDAYYVDNAGDVVTENAGAGSDVVRTTLASYTLTANVEHLSFIGSGVFTGTGNALNNNINGGAGNDTLNGKGGADRLNGGAGADSFVYTAASDSTGTGYDTLVGFDAALDKIDTWRTVTGIDAPVTSGALSSGAGFDGDLAAALSGKLITNHAVLFKPNAGTLSGHQFLIIDGNGTAGYQAGADLVLELTSPAHLTSIGLGTFT